MANLWTGTVKANDYVNLATVSGQTLSSGSKYGLQSYDNSFYLREGSTGKGYTVKAGTYVQITMGSSDIYVKPETLGSMELNLSSEG